MESRIEYPLLKKSEENTNLLIYEDKCDKYDYLTAVACGAIGGMIDIFLVGAPKDTVIGKWTDKQVENVVMEFARKMGWNPKEKNKDNVNSAIGSLERKFKINYDQRKPTDVKNSFNIAPKTHHMMSLAHSPDLIGLFFSILNQFTSTSSFIVDGKLITIETDTFELKGGNFIMKIMCGIANWFGHLMSDVAGSSGVHRENGRRGSGIVIPFYELFGFCKFGQFKIEENNKIVKKDLSELAMMAFTKEYDFRFGLAQAIPVVVTELSIRLIWAIRQHFQYARPIKECIPTMKHSNLRVMLLMGNGTLCVMDGIDAGIKSGGNSLTFFMRLNLIAWFRFVTLVIKEVCIRVGLVDALQKNVEAYKRINNALLECLHELEKVDIEAYKKETEEYYRISLSITAAKNEEELNRILLGIYEKMEWEKPWQGDFDEHMSNPMAHLTFKK